MQLEGLKGIHNLSGIECGYINKYFRWKEEIKYQNCDNRCKYIAFTLDGVTYVAVQSDINEDATSICRENLIVSNEKLSTVFNPVKVMCKYKRTEKTDDSFTDGNISCVLDSILQIYDINTNRLIIEVGTENINSDYHFFTCKFNPQNINRHDEINNWFKYLRKEGILEKIF